MVVHAVGSVDAPLVAVRSRRTSGAVGSSALVLDSWAILAWMQNEPAAQRVQRFLDDASSGMLTVSCSAINAGEVYSQLAKAGQPSSGRHFWHALVRGTMPVRLVAATTPRVRRAADIKARYPLAYADAFAIALAIELDCPLATGDPEIRRPEAHGLLALEWLGR